MINQWPVICYKPSLVSFSLPVFFGHLEANVARNALSNRLFVLFLADPVQSQNVVFFTGSPPQNHVV